MARLSAFADEVSDDFLDQCRFLSSEDIGHMEIRFVNGKNVMDLSGPELFSEAISATRALCRDAGLTCG